MPSVQGNFHHNLQETLYHITSARFRDLWCVHANIDSFQSLQNKTPEDLLTLATDMIKKYTSTEGLYNLDEKQENKRDDVLSQAVLWNRDILDYLILNNAIRTGDIGCIEDLLPCLLFRFVGGSNSKYAIEILELLQGMHKEWPSDLQCVFVNPYPS
jgi:hypothetical protein